MNKAVVKEFTGLPARSRMVASSLTVAPAPGSPDQNATDQRD